MFWFCDIHEFLLTHKQNIIWDELDSLVKANEKTREVSTILHILKEHWDTEIDPSIFSDKSKIERINFNRLLLDQATATCLRISVITWSGVTPSALAS